MFQSNVHLSILVEAKLCRHPGFDGCVLEPLHHHELLQLQEVLFVGGILHLPLIVDVSQK